MYICHDGDTILGDGDSAAEAIVDFFCAVGYPDGIGPDGTALDCTTAVASKRLAKALRDGIHVRAWRIDDEGMIDIRD